MRGAWKLWMGLLGLAIANRPLQALTVGWGIVRDRKSLPTCWVYPLRHLLGFFFWCASYYGREIVWRGERYRLASGGRMVRKNIPPPAAATRDSAV